MRHGFNDVLRPMLGWEPEIVGVTDNPPALKEWLKEDKIKNLVLTTCELRNAVRKLTDLRL